MAFGLAVWRNHVSLITIPGICSRRCAINIGLSSSTPTASAGQASSFGPFSPSILSPDISIFGNRVDSSLVHQLPVLKNRDVKSLRSLGSFIQSN